MFLHTHMYNSFLSPSSSLHSFFRSFTFSHSILYLSHLNPLPSSLISVYASLFLLPFSVSFPSFSTFSSFLVSFSASFSLSILKFFNLFVFLPLSRAYFARIDIREATPLSKRVPLMHVFTHVMCIRACLHKHIHT